VLVSLELLVERQLRVGEQLHFHLPVALVSLKRFEDRLRRQPLVNEKRQRRHVEREALRLSGPVEERPRECFQSSDCIVKPGYLNVSEPPRLGEQMRWIKAGGFVDLLEQPLA
jgi:hypothetical protein